MRCPRTLESAVTPGTNHSSSIHNRWWPFKKQAMVNTISNPWSRVQSIHSGYHINPTPFRESQGSWNKEHQQHRIDIQMFHHPRTACIDILHNSFNRLRIANTFFESPGVACAFEISRPKFRLSVINVWTERPLLITITTPHPYVKVNIFIHCQGELESAIAFSMTHTLTLTKSNATSHILHLQAISWLGNTFFLWHRGHSYSYFHPISAVEVAATPSSSSFSRTQALKLGILVAISKELRHNVSVLCRIKWLQVVDMYVCIG